MAWQAVPFKGRQDYATSVLQAAQDSCQACGYAGANPLGSADITCGADIHGITPYAVAQRVQCTGPPPSCDGRQSPRLRLDPPAPHRHGSPDGFDHTERPSALKKSVRGAQRAGHSECQGKPGAAVLERIAHEHRGHGKKAKCGKGAHERALYGPAPLTVCAPRWIDPAATYRSTIPRPLRLVQCLAVRATSSASTSVKASSTS